MHVVLKICLLFGGIAAAIASGVWFARAHKRRTDAQWAVVRRLLSADRWFTPKELTDGLDGHVDRLLYRELQRLVRTGDVDTLGAETGHPLHKLSKQGGERVREELYR